MGSVDELGVWEEKGKEGKKIDYGGGGVVGFRGEDVEMIEEIMVGEVEG